MAPIPVVQTEHACSCLLSGFISHEIIQSPRGLCKFFGLTILGFRCASPQALCCRPLRGLSVS